MGINQQLDQLKKIGYLQSLLEHQSLVKAAKAHHVTPSAISQAIKNLEESLGFHLVAKKKEGWVLTPQGSDLLKRMEPLFAYLKKELLSGQHDFEIKSLSIGAYESLALHLLGPLKKMVFEDFPSCKLQFVTGRSGELLNRLQAGEICSAIVAQQDEIPNGLAHQVVFKDRMGFYVSPTLSIETLEQTEGLTFGGLASGRGHPIYLQKFLRQFPEIEFGLLCDSFEIIREAAVRGECVALLPTLVAAKSQDKLIEIPHSKSQVGEHEIWFVSSQSCHKGEFDFLAKSVRQIF